MHRLGYAFGASLLVLSLVLAAAPVSSAALPPAGSQTIADQYIITFTPVVSDPAAKGQALAASLGLTVLHTYRYALNGIAARVPAGRLSLLQVDPEVAAVVPDQAMSLAAPTASARPGGKGQRAQVVPTGVQRIGGLVSPTAAINGRDERVDADVAIVDTGIDVDHPDLNVVGGVNCVLLASGYDDGHGHGTHVAGTVGAKDNRFGVVGVAPGARLWAVRVATDVGASSWSDMICGIDWVTANAATIDVANMSLSGVDVDRGCADGGLHQAICTSVAAGVTYVVAAGNRFSDASAFVPAAYDEVITVSALADSDGAPGGGSGLVCGFDEEDSFADFSNYGADIDLIAPGVCITSTWLGGGYETHSGTSMAAPHVAGAAALYKAQNPGTTPAQVQAALLAAGSMNWDNFDDPDGIKEPLVDVSTF